MGIKLLWLGLGVVQCQIRTKPTELRNAGWPEWLQKGVLFEEQEERDEWVAIYKLASQPWPAKYDVPGGCCVPKRARGAAAKQGLRAPGRHKTRSRLSGSESDMEIDDPMLPDMPKKSLYEAFKGTSAVESTAALAQAAVSGQSCGEQHRPLSASRVLRMSAMCRSKVKLAAHAGMHAQLLG